MNKDTLAQAALKLRRALDGANPTPVSVSSGWMGLREEYADVLCCVELLFGESDYEICAHIRADKMRRWKARLDAR